MRAVQGQNLRPHPVSNAWRPYLRNDATVSATDPCARDRGALDPRLTRGHLNRIWTFVLEATVPIHGARVAVGQGGGIWPMVAFGFGGLIVMTQMHVLGVGRPTRGGILVVYAARVTWVYASPWSRSSPP